MCFPKYGKMLKKPGQLLTFLQSEIALALKICLNIFLWI